MRTRAGPARASSDEENLCRRKGAHQGFGALLLLVGSALVFPTSSVRGSSVGSTLGYVLLAVGLGFWFDTKSQRALGE
jgi:hypothetical protein